MNLSPFVESTLVAACENIDTARELLVTALPFCLKDAINELVAAETKLRNVLTLQEEERRRAAMHADTEPPR